MKVRRRVWGSVNLLGCLALTSAASAQPRTTPARPAVARPASPSGPAAQVTPAVIPAPAAQVTPPPPPQAAPPPPPFRVAITSGINGQFSPVVCGDEPPAPVFANVAGQLAAEPDTLAFDAGDLLGPAAVTRLTVQHDVDAFTAAVAASGIRVMAFGHRDLSADRGPIIAALRALRARNLRHVLSNLHCDATHRELCEVVEDGDDAPVQFDSPAGRVALIAMVDPSALPLLSRDRAAGLTLDPLAEAVPRAVTAARAAGAMHVVVMVDPRARHEVAQALELAELFEPGQGPDALVVHDLPAGTAAIQTARSGVPIVSTRPGNALVLEPGSTRVSRAARSGAPPEVVTSFVNSTRQWLCTTYAQPLAGGRLNAELSRDAFAGLYLDVLRDLARADVAVLNRGAVRQPAGLFPIRGSITPLSLAAALPFDDSLHVARVTGAVLKALATSARAEGFYLRGVTVTGGAVKINGRLVDDAQQYRIITTGYIATGGDGGAGDDIEYERFQTATAQDVFLAWLRTPREGDITQAPSDPADHTRWNFRWTTDVAFSSTTIAANPFVGTGLTYPDPQLSRAQSLNLRIDTLLRADADNPYFTWDNGLRLQYGRASVTPSPSMVAMSPSRGPFDENQDLISYNTAFAWRWFRGDRKWYHPLPVALGFIETELDGPPTARDPDFHHLTLRPTIGARFELLERMTLNLTAGMNWMESLAPSQVTGSKPEFAIVGSLVARPGTLFTVGGRNIDGGFSVEYTLSDPGASDSQILRASGRLSIPLFQPLQLTLGYDLYARTVNGQAWGLGHDTTIGLRIAFSRSVQLF
jgi:2',3'-cyclic-nucleotide 2'-phosphodiesterase (5'-nucleotidase family)